MNKTTNLLFFSVLITVASIYSCKKGTESQSFTSHFEWTFGGQNYTANIDTSLKSILGQWTLIAGNGSTLHTLIRELNFSLNTIDVGTYSIGTGSGNYFGYLNEAGVFFQYNP